MNPKEPEPVYLKKAELARRLSVSPRTIEQWSQKRIIPHIAIHSRLNLYNFDEVLEVLETRYKVEAIQK
ncbi:helix-turn-helix domain-containing protein [Akkermansiaceae bacterium]|jgi:DNA-binding transcriptional MerR regulator|nr:helix-turn-helix domain-containing protein [Akkermansiaceae bacterium]